MVLFGALNPLIVTGGEGLRTFLNPITYQLSVVLSICDIESPGNSLVWQHFFSCVQGTAGLKAGMVDLDKVERFWLLDSPACTLCVDLLIVLVCWRMQMKLWMQRTKPETFWPSP